jgi:hypothetical protein
MEQMVFLGLGVFVIAGILLAVVMFIMGGNRRDRDGE